tara:strand:+ start:3197 stop:4180 length:984 start_codon:yes stop_codon:yes gene_type:complete
MNKTIKFFVDEKNNRERIDIFLTKNISDYTRSYIKKLIEKKFVKLNDEIIISASKKIKSKDQILIKLSNEETNKNIVPFDMKLDIVYEDNDILIINKPKGLVVHPGAGNSSKTLVNALLSRYKNKLSDLNGSTRPGIVHRLDKDTSGLLVIAKNNLAHSKLSHQFSNHSIKRKYLCLVWGVIRPLNGKIETLISRNKKNRQLMSVSEINGKKAITNYKTLKIFNIKDIPKISMLECELETGRTHQIRVHLKYKGSTIIGDPKYGKVNLKFKKINNNFFDYLKHLKGQILHAKTLEFLHPTKNKWVKYSSKLPSDFKKLLDLLNNLSG